MQHIIRIDVIGQKNFALRFVGSNHTADQFRVKPGDDIRFVAYRNNNKIDYQITFKSPDRSPFTDVLQIDMPHGGVSDAYAVTTLLAGGMPFNVRIPSLGWQIDPEILVDGATMNPALKELKELVQQVIARVTTARKSVAYTIKVHVTGNTFTFVPPTNPLPVHAGDTISWQITQDDVSAPVFTISFSANSAPISPLDNYENALGPDYYNGSTAVVASRIFRLLEHDEGDAKDFRYAIAMQTGATPPTSGPMTILLKP